jgi:DNA repair photolyase
VEAERRIMRGVLEVLQAFRHPVTVTTKGTLIERDADILGEMGQAGLAQAGISVTTLDAALARRMEPRCPSPARRLQAIERLAAAGCPVRVMVSPIIPGLTDHELEAILKAARDAGAVMASSIPLRLPLEVSELWQDWLAEHYPDRLGRVMTKIRDMHGGRDYDPEWGKRMTGEGLWADLLQRGSDVRSRLGARCPCNRIAHGPFRAAAARGRSAFAVLSAYPALRLQGKAEAPGDRS